VQKTMLSTQWKTAGLVLAACLTGTGFLTQQALAHEALTELSPAQFSRFHAFLRPRAHEMRFAEIPWMFDLWEARKKAAAEGKPLLILAASGNPCGTC
jgi:hypothetical protein